MIPNALNIAKTNYPIWNENSKMALPKTRHFNDNVISFSSVNSSAECDKKLGEIKNEIVKAKTIAIMGHVGADGDSVGSCAGLRNLIMSYAKIHGMDKEVHVFVDGGIPEGLKTIEDTNGFIYLNKTNKQKYSDKKYDLAIALDSPELFRLGKAESIFLNAPRKIKMDHHEANCKIHDFADINLVNGSITATTQIIMKLADKMEVPLNKNLASDIYLGILTDSSGLRNLKKPSQGLRDCVRLADTGIPAKEIYSNALDRMSRPMFEYYRKTLQEVKFKEQGRIAYIPESRAFIKTLSPKIQADVEGRNKTKMEIATKILPHIDGVKLVMRVNPNKNKEEGVKILLGSKDIPVLPIAKKFNGGGHSHAAGCNFINTNAAEALKAILGHVREKGLLDRFPSMQ